MDEETGTPDAEVQEETLEDLKQKFEDQRKRAEKAEAEAKEVKETLDSVVQQIEPQEPESLPTQEKGIGFDDLADNLAVLKPLESDEVEELRSQARDLDVDPIKFAQSPAWKAHLETLRVNKEAENDTPEPTGRTAVFDGKSFDEVIQDPETSGDVRQKAFEAQRDALLTRGNKQNI